jgi:hypothetical protein
VIFRIAPIHDPIRQKPAHLVDLIVDVFDRANGLNEFMGEMSRTSWECSAIQFPL